MRVTRCAVDVVASAAPNDTIIAENLRSEAQQIALAFINTPNVRHLQSPIYNAAQSNPLFRTGAFSRYL